MPVYDSVLGARLVAGGPAAQQQLEVACSTDDLSAGDRHGELAKLAAIAGVHAELVIEGEDGARHLLVIADGRMATFEVTDSRAADHDEPARGVAHAEVSTRVPADEVAELLAHEDTDTLDDDALALPYRWSDLDAMVTGMTTIGPLLEGGVIALVEIDERRYDVELAYGAVTVTPLYPRCTHLDRVLALVPDLAPSSGALTVPFAAAVTRTPASARDASQPLTTGSARDRERAFAELTEYRRKRVPLAPIIAAVRDEENRGDRYAGLRRDVYHYLAKYDCPEVCALWLWALREETDEVAKTVTYIGWRLESVVAKLPDERRAAEARGDTRTMARIETLQVAAR